MLPSSYREEARRLLADESLEGLLPRPGSVFWRTHDFGVIEYQTHGLKETLRKAIIKSLEANRRSSERAVIPVKLFYCITADRIKQAGSLDDLGDLPGKGVVTQLAGEWLCATDAPHDCLKKLLELEQGAQEAMLNRITDSDVSQEQAAPTGGSCGSCSSNLLGGDCDCMGSSCTRNSKS